MTIFKLFVPCVLLSVCSTLYAVESPHVEVGYEIKDFEDVADSKNVNFNTKIFPNDTIEAIYIDLQYKTWDLEDSRLKPEGFTANTVAYYNFGKDDAFFGSTQLQTATSNLFPKATVYQEVSYKFGDKKNILFGVGLGYQDYYDRDEDTFFKVGPVYYFDGGAVGYKYGEYTDSDTYSNSLFMNYRFNDHISSTIRYDFGEGNWNYEYLNIDDTTNVESSDLDIKVHYDINESLSPYLRFGKIEVENRDSDETIMESQNYGLGLKYSW